jgi:hypothetical protein
MVRLRRVSRVSVADAEGHLRNSVEEEYLPLVAVTRILVKTNGDQKTQNMIFS